MTIVTTPAIELDTRHYQWQPLGRLPSAIPEAYRQWIQLSGSLTKALKKRSDQFNVEIIDEQHIYLASVFEGFEQPHGTQSWFSRKVLLKNGDIPWVAAHTLVPQSSLNNGLTQLTQLENKPLGELLFATAGVSKDHEQTCQTANGWGRRARYLLKQQPLLVSEYFLPELIAYEQARTSPLL